MDFLAAILTAPSFYKTCLAWAVSATALAWFTLGFLHLRYRHRTPRMALARDATGAAAAVDLVLTLPIFLFILSCIVQLAIMSNNALIVHYAAYAAARSARVWDGGRDAGEHVRNAARYVLIAASPTGSGTPSSPVFSPSPQGALQAAAQASGESGRSSVLQRQARYAYTPANSNVSYTGGQGGPVTARVAFRMYLSIPVASRVFQEGGDRVRWIEAKVTLL